MLRVNVFYVHFHFIFRSQHFVSDNIMFRELWCGYLFIVTLRQIPNVTFSSRNNIAYRNNDLMVINAVRTLKLWNNWLMGYSPSLNALFTIKEVLLYNVTLLKPNIIRIFRKDVFSSLTFLLINSRFISVNLHRKISNIKFLIIFFRKS